MTKLALRAILGVLLLGVCPARAGVVAWGRVLGPGGGGVAGAIISDGHRVSSSGEDGSFRLKTQSGRILWAAAPKGFTVRGSWWRPLAGGGERITFRLERRKTKNRGYVALLSDLHLHGRGARPADLPGQTLLPTHPLKIWQDLTKRLAREPPLATLITGDLCANSGQQNPEYARKQMVLVKAALGRLPGPVRALPGNHDIRVDQGRVDRALWRRHLGPVRQVFLIGGAAWILLDNISVCRNLRKSEIPCAGLSEEALAWLGRVLEVLDPGLPLVILSHHPLASPVTGMNPLAPWKLIRNQTKALGLRDVEEKVNAVFSLLKGRWVLGFLAGHEHTAYEATLHTRGGPLSFWGIPALSGGWWRGDRTLGSVAFSPGWVRTQVRETLQGPVLKYRFIRLELP